MNGSSRSPRVMPMPDPVGRRVAELPRCPVSLLQRPVQRRPPSALRRVVDDVVVDQHPALEVLERRGRRKRGSRALPGRDMVTGEDQERSEPLSPTEGELPEEAV